MYNRLEAIRSGIFGISFSVLASIALVYFFMHIQEESMMNLVVACIILAVLVLCATWATLRPHFIYGGLHSFVWLLALAVCFPMWFNPLPLTIALVISMLLFFMIDKVMFLLYRLNSTIFISGVPIPKQPRPNSPENSVDDRQEHPAYY